MKQHAAPSRPSRVRRARPARAAARSCARDLAAQLRDRRARRRAARARRRRALGARAGRAAAGAAAGPLRGAAAAARRSRTAPATRGSRPCCRGARRGSARTRCSARRTSRRSRSRATWSCSTTPPRCAIPGWYSPAYAAVQRRLLPRIARARAARDHRVGVRRAPSCASCSGSSASASSRAASTRAFAPGADAARRAPRSASRGRTCSAWPRTRRARTSARSCRRRARWRARGSSVAVAGGHRPQFAAEQGLGALRLLGHVPDGLLPGLYAGAEAFALPSLYEGFGLPVLEAMAAGTPVVAADTAALPETCGGAAIARRRPTARRSAPRCWRCSATPPSASACAPPAWRARRASAGTRPRAASTP